MYFTEKMITNKYLEEIIQSGSLIRKMFELKEKARQEGKNPIDFSLGNPNIGPPDNYYNALNEIILECRKSKQNPHAYMSNAGYYETREKVALDMSKEYNLDFKPKHIFMTAGAANALDILMRTLLNPIKTQIGDKNEVICIAPYFIEYNYYIGNNNGKKIIVDSDNNFDLDLDKISNAITKRTKVVLLNSPNNPTGVVYSDKKLAELTDILKEKNKKFKTTISVVEDAPYDKLVWGNNKFNSILPYYKNTFYVTSYSKTWGIAGERIGHIAVHPNIGKNFKDREDISEALPIILRTKGVNAPALQQRIVGKLGCNIQSDITKYKNRIDFLAEILKENNFEFQMPQGTFYVWAKISDTYNNAQDFIKYALQGQEPMFVTNGTAFGGEKYNQYVRFSVSSVNESDIKRAKNKLQEMKTQKLKDAEKRKRGTIKRKTSKAQ